ncbi:MAG: CPBP family intramembrane metalloprotease [Promethearchaeota archaeon]|nr:MAG: CPBP family intramembrane metalloprotease [Candidatus Lokiarchaeota archaeon]
MDQKYENLIKITPYLLYIGLCTIILLLDFNIWIKGSEEYPRFYIMPIIFSIIFYLILIYLIHYIKERKELKTLEGPVDFRNTVLIFMLFMAVLWIPRQFMIWKFGITFEKLPLLYMITTQIILVEGLYLSEFGLKKENVWNNIFLGCLLSFIYFGIITLFHLGLSFSFSGVDAFYEMEMFELSQFITFPYQALAVGVAEELIFRGYFFTKMRKAGKSFWYSTLFTSTVFMIFHIPWLINIDLSLNLYIPYIISKVINTFPFAIVCCYLYEKTGSLVAPIVFHGFHNSLSTFIYFSIPLEMAFSFELVLSIITFFILLLMAFLVPIIVSNLNYEEKK